MSLTTKAPTKSRTSSIDSPSVDFSRFRFFVCNYSLRQCAIYLIIFDIALLFVSFLIVGYSYSYINVNMMMRQSDNTSVFHVVVNDEIVVTIDFYHKNSMINISELIRKILVGTFSYLIMDLVIDIMGFLGILWDQSMLVIPYIVLLGVTIVWIAIIVIIDIILSFLHLFSWPTMLAWFVLVVFELQKCYKFLILYSYVFYYGALSYIDDNNLVDDSSKNPSSPVRIVPRPGQGPQSITLEPLDS